VSRCGASNVLIGFATLLYGCGTVHEANAILSQELRARYLKTDTQCQVLLTDGIVTSSSPATSALHIGLVVPENIAVQWRLIRPRPP
jgi:hypothetical protein